MNGRCFRGCCLDSHETMNYWSELDPNSVVSTFWSARVKVNNCFRLETEAESDRDWLWNDEKLWFMTWSDRNRFQVDLRMFSFSLGFRMYKLQKALTHQFNVFAQQTTILSITSRFISRAFPICLQFVNILQCCDTIYLGQKFLFEKITKHIIL